MLQTIRLGTCVWVQGRFVKSFADGRMSVRVGKRVFIGQPV